MKQGMKSLFCRISKVDEEKRTVTGIGASEAIDADGEIFDYDTSKVFIESWSEGAQQRSRGKSFGNIREMHQLSAVGKLSEPIVFDDAQKLVILTSYISDDQGWKKCSDGTYTGFSICGPIVGEKWSDGTNPGVKRYTCAPIEFSVCDLPCNEEAVFTAVKVGGVTEQRKFKTATAVEEEPIVAKEVATKSMYSIQDLASVISSLRYVQDDLAYEAEYEGDASPIPDKLKAWISEGCEILVDLAREETAELVTAMKTNGGNILAKRFAPAEMVEKAGKGVKKDPIAKCTKALASIGECLGKTCKCQDLGKCADKMCAAHADATDAIGQIEPDADDKDSDANKALGVAAQAAPITQQGSGPEIEDEMDEATKAQIAAAEQNSAKALEVAEKTNQGLEQIAKALAGLTNLIAGEPVAPKSVGTGAVVAVSKSAEVAGEPITVANTPESVAKSIRSNPHYLSNAEAASLNIGR